ncbi:hypothetical protein PVAP13_9NG323600 [Panicum virgatum]|uniref:Uncharacterized protein n=1 Tax=Panicum virgatum TaxID=38727 RepID=A0A8T0MP53_PANVG|nr:hypothetical protein PVAP13_9NG323600 [Panicum virgatum]KAG2537912.1 hypothetical protein PVAP13_9NG323600 [Panicum virgatum]
MVTSAYQLLSFTYWASAQHNTAQTPRSHRLLVFLARVLLFLARRRLFLVQARRRRMQRRVLRAAVACSDLVCHRGSTREGLLSGLLPQVGMEFNTVEEAWMFELAMEVKKDLRLEKGSQIKESPREG